MYNELFISFISYAILSTITPGPNNISSTSAGMELGYKKTLPYIFGIVFGFFIIMIFAGFFTSLIIENTLVLTILKWLGAFYIVYLGLAPLLPKKVKSSTVNKSNYTFLSGMLLQLLNIKAILYSITIYTAFAEITASSQVSIVFYALMLCLLAFACISLWTVIGSSLSKLFCKKSFYYLFNGFLALMMIFIAISILLDH